MSVKRALPVLGALLLLCTVFQIANANFLSPLNLTNLLMQIAAMGTLACGVVLVLLLGEIDLSAGAVSGLCAAIMAVLHVKHGVPGPLAVTLSLAAGAVIGGAQGFWVTRLRVPSFIVTLAGLLTWQGALLWVLGSTGTLNLRDGFVVGLANTFLPPLPGVLCALGMAGVYAARLLLVRRARVLAALPVARLRNDVVRVVVLAASLLLVVLVLNADRGMPSGILILVAVVLLGDFLIVRMRFGRHVLAVGSHVEAARRAGVPVHRVRVLVFALSSTLAAAGGILAASRLLAVNQSSGAGDVLLNAIAAAVIGGTSLFGGQGSVWSALLGSMVIGVISNGMDLLALDSAVKFMVTGGVLLLAVTADAAARG